MLRCGHRLSRCKIGEILLVILEITFFYCFSKIGHRGDDEFLADANNNFIIFVLLYIYVCEFSFPIMMTIQNTKKSKLDL